MKRSYKVQTILEFNVELHESTAKRMLYKPEDDELTDFDWGRAAEIFVEEEMIDDYTDIHGDSLYPCVKSTTATRM